MSLPTPATQILEGALGYLRCGISVIPLRPYDKRPAVSWAEFQRRRPTESECRGWWSGSSRLGVAVVCGRVSGGLAAVDEDARHGGPASLAAYPALTGPIVQTGGGGHHYYLAAGATLPKIPALLPGVDLQGEGSYVVAPPSIHPNGTPYQWTPGRGLGEVPLPAVPFWLRRLIRLHQTVPPIAEHQDSAEAPLALTEVLATLTGVRRVAGGWVACCPVHDDREPSLSIGVGAKQAVLLHCHAGCSYSSIRARLTGRPVACR